MSDLPTGLSAMRSSNGLRIDSRASLGKIFALGQCYHGVKRVWHGVAGCTYCVYDHNEAVFIMFDLTFKKLSHGLRVRPALCRLCKCLQLSNFLSYHSLVEYAYCRVFSFIRLVRNSMRIARGLRLEANFLIRRIPPVDYSIGLLPYQLSMTSERGLSQ
jgi:hypothetical protein